MKRLTMNCMFAAAALTAVAGSASAQILKAEIPFTFHAGQSRMEAGSYEVKTPQGASAYLTLRNTDTGKAVMTVYSHPDEARGRGEPPRLTFACAGGRCVLQQVWPGGAERGYSLQSPRFARGEALITREIPLSKANSN
jgi:hypothetical protein